MNSSVIGERGVVKSLGSEQEVPGSNPGDAESAGSDGIICKYLLL